MVQAVCGRPFSNLRRGLNFLIFFITVGIFNMGHAASLVEKIKKEDFRFPYPKDENFYLKNINQGDLIYTLQWRNHYRSFFNSTHEISLEEHRQWYKQYQNKYDDLVLLVFDFQDRRLGQGAIYNIDEAHSRAEFGRFMVNPDFSGLGFMKAACEAMLALSQSVLKIETVYLQVKPDNRRAQHVYERCGFVPVKILENGNIFMEPIPKAF